MFEIDEIAKAKAIRYGMPPDVHIPISARDKDAITKYIGNITNIASVSPDKAFIVTPHCNPETNIKLPLWRLKESSILHKRKQVWVHVDYKSYRQAYIKATPEEDVKGMVLDHILNRRVARLKGFYYVRIIPVSPGVNTSSGGVTEKYGYDYHNSDHMKKINRENQAFIEYADLADLVKMLNFKTGGLLQTVVNESQYLLIEE
jgi:hypothetical protein